MTKAKNDKHDTYVPADGDGNATDRISAASRKHEAKNAGPAHVAEVEPEEPNVVVITSEEIVKIKSKEDFLAAVNEPEKPAEKKPDEPVRWTP